MQIDSYKIIEACKDARHQGDCFYCVVEFYSAGQLVLIEDFQMPHLKTTASQPVTNSSGDYVLADGSTLTKKEIADAQDAFNAAVLNVKDSKQIEAAQAKYLEPIDAKFRQVQRQTVTLDVATQIKENVERYMQQAGSKGISGDRRDKTIKPTDKQAAGISQRPEVQALKVAKPMKKAGAL